MAVTPQRPGVTGTTAERSVGLLERTQRLHEGDQALVGFQGLILTCGSETLNSFLRPLKNNGFKEDTERKNRILRHGYIHDPGIQQEPIGIVVVGAQVMSAEVDDLMPRRAELGHQFLLQNHPPREQWRSQCACLLFPSQFGPSCPAAARSASTWALSWFTRPAGID